ncbi:uncharacterized protein LOC125068238 [Vanessa atalanta]|uniref:uncharacterized protein LOC125068238 n=1 Tax=Vanessa atalanta TaxID=42275 RepID=UPI001FCD5726|nr:uncharacterized protein LOC125068238 [Vanessa atalanta]
MENKKSPSNKKLISIQEEKLIRQVDYDSIAESSTRLPKKLFLEIFRKGSSCKNPSQKVLVSIKPKSPAIKTLFLAEKNKFQSKKHSTKAGSRLALGDYSSLTSHYSDNDSNTLNSTESINYLYRNRTRSEIIPNRASTTTTREDSTTGISKCINTESSSVCPPFYKNHSKQHFTEKCYVYTQPQFTMTIPKVSKTFQNNNRRSNKTDIGTFVVTNSSSQDILTSTENINNLNKRLEQLERKVLRQQMLFRSIDPNISLSSSDEDSKARTMKKSSSHGRPGCSYVEYSQIPETSAFQRYSQQPAPLSASKATTIQKEHNSEQYGRDFTLYDGITARGRRQCASVPCKRDDGPRIAADRVHKIRHKLNPVRDYRLMDTVHYLAQGEFAPRDDGIKLTPSREAVLSDIIWEDVCRTHWPNTRLARRLAHSERYGPKSELQRLIDSLLRERVAHVERRRRRHYRIVKLNHRHENCRPMGKTGDIIVASHKKIPCNDDNDIVNGHTYTRISMQEGRHKKALNPGKTHTSHDPVLQSEIRQRKQFRQEDCPPGPSYSTRHSRTNREPTCCYHTSSPSNQMGSSKPASSSIRGSIMQDLTSDSSNTNGKVRQKNPRLVIKKKSSRKKYKNEEPNLEHFILLPTLVVKTPSNMKRQKKFNELYHRILNVQFNKAKAVNKENEDLNSNQNKIEYGLNINDAVPNSEESIKKNNF